MGQAAHRGLHGRGPRQGGGGTATSLTLVFCRRFLRARALRQAGRHAGAGTLVPITGFANAMVSPALEFRSEGFVMGMSAKLFTIAGPVLVFGITASILYGIILQLFFR